MIKFLCSLLLFCFLSFQGRSQQATFYSRSEVGFLFGGTYYIGDLNRFNNLKNMQLAGGLLYRYQVNPRVGLRGNFMYGNVKGEDSQSTSQLFKNRNLDFTSSIFEIAGGIELNYFPFEIGHNRFKGTAYMLAEIGLFKMNPMSTFDGENIELQPLGTEGQGSSLSKRDNYSLTQLCIPLGFGARISLGKWTSINFEFGLRKTFTDYLDDVHADSYVDPILLSSENGPLAATMANKSLDRAVYGKRGTSTTKDWYVFSGIMITFKLGQRSGCPFAN